ncbi:MAG TPA: VOC family protein [Longimicrobium sp.]|nr:VOC family protein [Longimicrobium sp.]
MTTTTPQAETPTPMRHAPGSFCWIELAAHDRDAAERFYTALFGWTARHDKIGPEDDDLYVMLQKDGRDVGALYSMMADQRQAGIPSHWMSYVSVDSADGAAARARELGGTVLAEPFDVMQYGRMAVVSDPAGAAFSLWEARAHHGVGVRDEPGSLCWNELATTDTDGARRFYEGLFAWASDTMDVGMEYTTFLNGEAQAGGMYGITDEMKGMPPMWLPYFAVEDTDAAAERAKELGGTVHVPPTDIPGIGRFSMLMDPQGAVFHVIRLAPMDA